MILLLSAITANDAAATADGISRIDPTPAIAASWALSALLLGGLAAFAIVSARRAAQDTKSKE